MFNSHILVNFDYLLTYERDQIVKVYYSNIP